MREIDKQPIGRVVTTIALKAADKVTGWFTGCRGAVVATGT